MRFLKYFFIISGILSVLILVMGYFLYTDVIDLKEDMPVSSNMVILVKENNIPTGVVFHPDEEIVPISQKQIDDFNEYYQENELDKIQGDHYKVIFVDYSLLESSEVEELDFEVFKLSKEKALEIVVSERATALVLEEVVDKLVESLLSTQNIPEEHKDAFRERAKEGIRNQLKEEMGSDADVRGMVFASFFPNIVGGEEDLFILLRYFKEGSIKIYPETAIFKFIKIMPLSIAEKLVKKR